MTLTVPPEVKPIEVKMLDSTPIEGLGTGILIDTRLEPLGYWTSPALTQEKVAKVLTEAADLIEAGGWCQNTGYDEAGRRCAGQAMADAASRVLRLAEPGNDSAVLYRAAYSQLARTIGAEDPVHRDADVIRWNDRALQTKQNVVSTLRAAAAQLA